MARSMAVDRAGVLRLLLLSAAAGTFLTLLLAASRFTGDYSFAGLSDEAVRKVGHFTVYGGASALLALALGRQHLLAWILAVCLSTAEEVHQLWVVSRFACVDDWAVNVAGITVCLLVSAWLVRTNPQGTT